MPFVSGYLRVRGGGQVDNELPDGSVPIDPDYGIDSGSVNNDLPRPPPGVFPPPVPAHPIVPAPPNTPPGVIWPPVNPPRPSQGLPPSGSGGQPDQGLPPSGEQPDQGLPGSGGRPDNTLPGQQKFWVVVWIPGYGYKYVCVDPSLSVGHPIAPPAASNKPVEPVEPPTSAQPKKPI